MLRSVLVAGLLVGALGAFGCSSHASAADTGAAVTDDALKAFQDGRDASIPITADNVAVSSAPPSALPPIASWSIEYDTIDAEDPDPNNRYVGVMMTGYDESGAPVLLVPKAILDSGVATFYFRPTPDADGNLVPYALDGDDALSAAAWIQSEASTLGSQIAAMLPDGSDDGTVESASHPGLSLHPLSGTLLGNGIECAAHLAVFVLAFTNPVAFLVADAAVTLVGGVANGNIKGGIVGGVVELGLAGTIKLVASKVGMAAGRSIIPVAAAVSVGYQAYEGKSAGAILKSFVPASCMTVAEAVINQ